MELDKTADCRPQTVDQFGRIGVLMGGPSTEREISFKSGHAVSLALKDLGLEVVDVDIASDSLQENAELLKTKDIDCAFLALHGRFGEDGQIQQILGQMHIPYTGSGVMASKQAMDKAASHKILKANNLNVPKHRIINRDSKITLQEIYLDFKLPLVIKPANGGSSIGLSIIEAGKDFNSALDLAFSVDDKVIIEEYIKGRELTVGILDEEALPVVEIVTQRKFFDYEAKYKAGLTEYIVPAQLEDDVALKISEAAISAHKYLGCYGSSRVDIILDKNNVPFILEINTIPGMTATSLLPKAAKAKGVEFGQLCLKLIGLAYEKKENQAASPV
ncbi:MAG: D-alanine--D-alanine ligase [Candidatus Omnitrophota bacterium]